MIVAQVWTISNNFILLAIPLFILMAMIIEKSKMADDLYEMMYLWFGPLRGGLAVGTILICTIFAAMCGISGTATITMTAVALPSMLKKGYDKSLAIGCINSGGGMGNFDASERGYDFVCLNCRRICWENVRRRGFFPTFFLLILDTIYILTRSYFQPSIAPGLPKEERVSLKVKLVSLKSIFFPGCIILSVLGSIVFGIASPTEAGAVGVFATIIAVRKNLSIKLLFEALGKTFQITGMVMWVIFGAVCMSAIFQGIGCDQVVENIVTKLPAGDGP